MPKLYLAGPMRGRPEFNFPAFQLARIQLREQGFEVFCPAENDLAGGFDPAGMSGYEDLAAHGFDLRRALAEDLDYIARQADGVAILDGWDKSLGAKAEVAVAHALDLPVRRVAKWIHHEEVKRLATMVGQRLGENHG